MEIVKVKVELKVGVKENHFNNGVTDVTDFSRTFFVYGKKSICYD